MFMKQYKNLIFSSKHSSDFNIYSSNSINEDGNTSQNFYDPFMDSTIEPFMFDQLKHEIKHEFDSNIYGEGGADFLNLHQLSAAPESTGTEF